MSVNRIAAALAVAGVVVSSAPARAVETTTVAYSSERAAYLSVVFRESVDDTIDHVANLVGNVVSGTVHGVTKADCTFQAIGSDLVGGIQGVFVAHVVVTKFQNRSGRPIDSIPAATGIICSVRNGGNVIEWTAARPGNSAYDARVQALPFGNIEICAQVWVVYGDGDRVDYPIECEHS